MLVEGRMEKFAESLAALPLDKPGGARQGAGHG